MASPLTTEEQIKQIFTRPDLLKQSYEHLLRRFTREASGVDRSQVLLMVDTFLVSLSGSLFSLPLIDFCRVELSVTLRSQCENRLRRSSPQPS